MAESLSWRLHPYTHHKEACAVMLAGRDGADEACSCGLDDLLYAEIGRLVASEQEAARLRTALRHYGQHDEACHIARCQYDEQQNVLPGSHCGCGLLQALGATTAPEAERAGPPREGAE
jgi:hypothetical protein